MKQTISHLKPRYLKSIEKLTKLNNLQLSSRQDIDFLFRDKGYRFTLIFQVRKWSKPRSALLRLEADAVHNGKSFTILIQQKGIVPEFEKVLKNSHRGQQLL